ncbi:hypothetical protein H072_4119 [Dactylellina haptotyla CBS 200.50]|uniref:F-box domain-containing protein n=1 Tax=Dactylellina haptotyla (strain CBS 200.50) TaxID=1284197 RepID=S8AFT0_DACHA|nr:hypothetical protein H072_4119 [Dactylellina haptotyla CBS 200.50]
MFKNDFQISTIPEVHSNEASPNNSPHPDDYDVDPSDNLDQKPLILNLSIDIIALIIEYLSFRDTIALSLTTKGFRHLRPQGNPNSPLSTPLSPPFSPGSEALCSARIHQRFLCSKSSRPSCHKCPYCQDDMCPPTCSTAQILDTQTGIFFPGSLYAPDKATFKYSTEYSKRESALLTPSLLTPNVTNFRDSLLLSPSQRDSFMGLKKRESLLISPKRNSMMHLAINTPKPVEFVYSTIWCDHHRCPKDLLAQKRDLKTDNENGAGKFLVEYNNELRWERTRRDRGPRYQLWSRWLVGYKSEPTPQLQRAASAAGSGRRKSIIPWLDSQPDSAPGSTRRKSIIPWFDRERDPSLAPPPPPASNPGSFGSGHRKSLFSWLDKFKDPSELEEDKQPEEVYERSFYETFCLHCLRPLKVQTASKGLHSNWLGLTCECITSNHCGGCRRCGITSVRFTLVEAFDKVYQKRHNSNDGYVRKQSYWILLATECEIVRDAGPGSAVEPKRLRPRDAVANNRALNMIRGYSITPLPEMPRIGITDLPYNVMHCVVEYLRDGQSRDPHFWAMQASYCFPKSWQGSFGDFRAMNVHEDSREASHDDKIHD